MKIKRNLISYVRVMNMLGLDLKILFPGQENNDLGGEFGEGGASSPEELMKLYDRFVRQNEYLSTGS